MKEILASSMSRIKSMATSGSFSHTCLRTVSISLDVVDGCWGKVVDVVGCSSPDVDGDGGGVSASMLRLMVGGEGDGGGVGGSMRVSMMAVVVKSAIIICLRTKKKRVARICSQQNLLLRLNLPAQSTLFFFMDLRHVRRL